MKKLLVKPIDWTGCLPDVKEALMDGYHPLCETYNGPVRIVGYHTGAVGLSYAADDGEWYEDVEPIYKITELRIKNAIEIMKQLVQHGYTPDSTGDWMPHDNTSHYWSSEMWSHCGESADGWEHCMESAWTKEVEIEE